MDSTNICKNSEIQQCVHRLNYYKQELAKCKNEIAKCEIALAKTTEIPKSSKDTLNNIKDYVKIKVFALTMRVDDLNTKVKGLEYQMFYLRHIDYVEHVRKIKSSQEIVISELKYGIAVLIDATMGLNTDKIEDVVDQIKDRFDELQKLNEDESQALNGDE